MGHNPSFDTRFAIDERLNRVFIEHNPDHDKDGSDLWHVWIPPTKPEHFDPPLQDRHYMVATAADVPTPTVHCLNECVDQNAEIAAPYGDRWFASITEAVAFVNKTLEQIEAESTTVVVIPGRVTAGYRDGKIVDITFMPAGSDAGHFGEAAVHDSGPDLDLSDNGQFWSAVQTYLQYDVDSDHAIGWSE